MNAWAEAHPGLTVVFGLLAGTILTVVLWRLSNRGRKPDRDGREITVYKPSQHEDPWVTTTTTPDGRQTTVYKGGEGGAGATADQPFGRGGGGPGVGPVCPYCGQYGKGGHGGGCPNGRRP